MEPNPSPSLVIRVDSWVGVSWLVCTMSTTVGDGSNLI